jgi:PKD repeat protein
MNKLKFILCLVPVFILYSLPGYGTTTYEWDFGDGQYSYEENTTHVFSTWGDYDWTFTRFENGVPCCTDWGTVCVNYYEWNFGDGTISYEKNPIHQYAAPGEYDWTFVYINCKGQICTTYGTIIITDPPPIFNLVTPNGGENILPFTIYDITWNAQYVSNPLKILLLQNDAEVGIIANSVSAGSGQYKWTAATYEGGTATGTGWKIRIKDSVTGNVLDTSDASFSISDQSAITVTSPNGGENWLPGTIQNITWTASNLGATVKITLWQNGVLKGTIADTLDPISSPYPWTVGKYVGGTAEPGTGYTVKIKETGTYVADNSDAAFTISSQPVITVTSPNGGETWPQGQTRYITWNYSNLTYALKITLWQNGGLIGTIWDNLDYASCSYAWTVGNYSGGVAPQGSGYTIKIKEIGTFTADNSDSPFTIGPGPVLWLISPNGGERWSRGLVHNITWNSLNVTNTIKLILLKNGTAAGTIAQGLSAGTGTYSWTVGNYTGGTAAPGTGYTIQARDNVTNAILDVSNASFSIFLNI